ncbi:MAG: alpha-L-arabinofuranosidase [Butyrivibrio sp.]|uniref:alpha-L-arabinofuranosidase C-terminal domain-containing protein n=1 Tax=Butyrivibrio sp. TaxID=28121 RepID=UPI001B2251BC|nr:alpha-L-arabinofuranosidase C-terminal domain-containing protein [Butyrivibrio sp.]MBO6239457.1 alpha-L-arabinofuranosidase [Butyrivibrio sp.]
MGKTINKGMFGLFFEDINYGLDGGLHAEMLENRSFEFLEAHGYKCNYYQKGAYLYGWNAYPFAGKSEIQVSENESLNDVNPHYLVLNNNEENAGFSNKAYDGIFLSAGKSANVSFYAKVKEEKTVTVNIFSQGGKKLCHSEEILLSGNNWKKYETKISAPRDIERGLFVVLMKEKGRACFDQFRMYPEDAVLGLFRKDLCELLKDLKPGFMRFPGGCVVEGNELSNRYQWKLTVGPSEERKANWNRWAVHGNDDNKGNNKDLGDFPYYNQTLGIGFYEYFLLCEYLGCEPLPVMNVGLACQYQSDQLIDSSAPEFNEYVQDALDLIEFANGDTSTKWGSLRAKMGHPESFGLKFIGIGNEQWETRKIDFFHRYDVFEKAIHDKYPDIKCCGSAGPDVTSDHYREAWDNFSPKMKAKSDYSYAVDEHYYVSDEWLYDNVHMYDYYDRHRKVFAGEYACHINPDRAPEKRNSFGAALAEAAFMTGLEKNADVVLMASYAPLFARLNYTQWQPDLIWFNGKSSYGTPSYYVQKIYSNFTGTELIDVDYDDLEKDRVYVTATKDDEHVYVKIINAGAKDVDIDLSKILVDGKPLVNGIIPELQLYTMKGNADNCNSIEQPQKVALVSNKVSIDSIYESVSNSIAVIVL